MSVQSRPYVFSQVILSYTCAFLTVHCGVILIGFAMWKICFQFEDAFSVCCGCWEWSLVVIIGKNQMAMKNFDGLCMVLILHLLTLSCLKLCFDLWGCNNSHYQQVSLTKVESFTQLNRWQHSFVDNEWVVELIRFVLNYSFKPQLGRDSKMSH